MLRRENTSSKATNLLVVGGVVAATAAAAALLFLSLTKKPNRSNDNAKANELKNVTTTTTDISKEKLVQVLQEITTGVQQVIMGLAQKENEIAQSAEAQKLTQAQIQQYLIARFQEGVATVESKVYQKAKITEADVKSASLRLEKDGDVMRAVKQLKTVYGAVMGANQGDLPEVPEFLTKEKTLEILTQTMEILRNKVKTVSEELLKEGIDRKSKPEEFQSKFHLLYGKEVETARRKLYSEMGLEDDMIIQAAVVKFQKDPSFQLQLKQRSEEHNQEMARLGFFPGQTAA